MSSAAAALVDSAAPPSARPDASHSYYKHFPAFNFRNLDTDAVYKECEDAIKLPKTKNFVVDFGGAAEDGGEAWCALDVDAQNIKALLEKRRQLELRTRWM
jgi:hypothetical protein